MRADRRLLHAVLSVLVRVIGPKRNAAMPTLDAVRITTARGGSEATLTATDLTTTLSATVPVEPGTPLDTCIDAKTLARILKPQGRDGAGDVALEPADDHSMVVHISGMTTKLPDLDPQSFSAGVGHEVPDDRWTHAALWPAADVGKALSYVAPAASRDPTRLHLCCIAIDPVKEVIVATDGHRLHKVPAPAPWHGPQVLLATGAAELLERILGEDEFVALSVAGGTLRARHSRWTLTTKLVDALFPPWEMVVPRAGDAQIRISVESAALASALARVARATGGHAAKWRVNGAITLSSWSADAGEAELTVPVQASSHGDGDDLVVGLDTRYVKDAIVGAATAELRFGGVLDPLRVDLAGERCAVIMPLRV